jgi:hypothetical protein
VNREPEMSAEAMVLVMLEVEVEDERDDEDEEDDVEDDVAGAVPGVDGRLACLFNKYPVEFTAVDVDAFEFEGNDTEDEDMNDGDGVGRTEACDATGVALPTVLTSVMDEKARLSVDGVGVIVPEPEEHASSAA